MLWAVLMKTTNLAIGKLRSRWSSSVGLSRYANANPCPRCVCSPHIHNTQISKHISVAYIRIYICMFRVFVVRLNVDDDVCVIERRLLLLLLIASRDVHDATAAAAKLLLVRSQSERGIRVEQDQQGKGWRGWKWRSNWWLFRPFCALIIMSVRIVYMEPVFIWMFIFFCFVACCDVCNCCSAPQPLPSKYIGICRHTSAAPKRKTICANTQMLTHHHYHQHPGPAIQLHKRGKQAIYVYTHQIYSNSLDILKRLYWNRFRCGGA